MTTPSLRRSPSNGFVALLCLLFAAAIAICAPVVGDPAPFVGGNEAAVETDAPGVPDRTDVRREQANPVLRRRRVVHNLLRTRFSGVARRRCRDHARAPILTAERYRSPSRRGPPAPAR